MTCPSAIFISGDLDLEVSIDGLPVWRGRSYRQARLVAESWQIECDDVSIIDRVSPLTDEGGRGSFGIGERHSLQ